MALFSAGGLDESGICPDAQDVPDKSLVATPPPVPTMLVGPQHLLARGTPDSSVPSTPPPAPPVTTRFLGKELPDLVPAERAGLSSFLDRWLGQQPSYAPLGQLLVSLFGSRLNNRANAWLPALYSNDPSGDFAVSYLRERYPNLFTAVPSVSTGVRLMPEDIMGTTDRFTKDISLAPSERMLPATPGDDYPQDDPLSTLRHELGHVAGLSDYRRPGFPSAYDISRASMALHQDIPLPKGKK